MKIIKNEQGFVVSVTAVVMSVILGSMVLYFSNSVTTNVTSSSNNFSSSQARWSAISGMELIFRQLPFGPENIAGVYPFYNGSITIDTMTINPVDGKMLFTSTATHSSSTRIFSITATPLPADSLLEEGFEDDSSFTYDPGGEGPGPRYWGLNCSGSLPNNILPQYVLLNADSCFFFGAKIQNNSNLIFEPMVTNGEGNYELKLSLGAGKDRPLESQQSDFQTGDFFEIIVNGIIVERWEGISEQGGNPMWPTLGNATEVLAPQFDEFTFNLSTIIEELDTINLSFEGKTNMNDKYLGIQGISLLGLGGWAIDTGSYKEI